MLDLKGDGCINALAVCRVSDTASFLTCLFFPFLQTSVPRLVPKSSLCRILPSTGTNQTSPGSRVSRWHRVRNWDVSEIRGISKDFP